MRLGKAILVIGMTSVVLASGCSWDRIEQQVPNVPKEIARSLFDAVRSSDIEKVMALVHPELDKQIIRSEIPRLFPVFANLKDEDIQFGSWLYTYEKKFNQQTAVEQHQLTYEIRIGERYLLAFIAVQEHAGKPFVAAFNWQVNQRSLIDHYQFSLAEKSLTHYYLLAGVIFIPAFCIYCLVLCWKRRPRRRWLWLLFIAITAPGLSFDWSTGEHFLDLLSVSLLGGGWSQMSRLEPVILNLGIPVGAMLFVILQPGAVRTRLNPALETITDDDETEARAVEGSETRVTEDSDIDSAGGESSPRIKSRRDSHELRYACSALLVIGGFLGVFFSFGSYQDTPNYLFTTVLIALLAGCITVGCFLWTGADWSLPWARLIYLMQVPVIVTSLVVYQIYLGLGIRVVGNSESFRLDFPIGFEYALWFGSPVPVPEFGINLVALACAIWLLQYRTPSVREVMKSFLNAFILQGRTNRNTWWLWLTVFVLSALAVLVLHLSGVIFNPVSFSSLMVISLLLMFFWLLIAASVRRLHDLGRSGWYVLLGFIPYAGPATLAIWLGFFQERTVEQSV